MLKSQKSRRVSRPRPNRESSQPAPNELIALTRRLDALTAREYELRALLERQRTKLAQTVQSLGRYFADFGKAIGKLESANIDAGKAQVLHEIRVAAEYARQGLPNVR